MNSYNISKQLEESLRKTISDSENRLKQIDDHIASWLISKEIETKFLKETKLALEELIYDAESDDIDEWLKASISAVTNESHQESSRIL